MTKTSVSILLATLAAASVVGSAGAQICTGFPTGDGQLSIAANAQFVDESEFGDILGVEANYNALGPVSVFGGITIVDGQGVIDNVNIYSAGLAYELPSLGASVGPSVSICPQLSLSYGAIEDVGSGINVPLGLGIGANLAGGTGVTISPFVVPQVIFSRFEADGPGDDDSETSTDLGVYGGMNLGFRNFWVGGTINHVFVGGGDPQFGIRVGIRL